MLGFELCPIFSSEQFNKLIKIDMLAGYTVQLWKYNDERVSNIGKAKIREISNKYPVLIKNQQTVSSIRYPNIY